FIRRGDGWPSANQSQRLLVTGCAQRYPSPPRHVSAPLQAAQDAAHDLAADLTADGTHQRLGEGLASALAGARRAGPGRAFAVRLGIAGGLAGRRSLGLRLRALGPLLQHLEGGFTV